MNTFQVAKNVLEGYKVSHLSDERIDNLLSQAYQQISEISQNRDIYDSFCERVNTPIPVDTAILWILFMSNEYIRCKYIEYFQKEFIDSAPISDLADLLIYAVYLKKVKNKTLDGYEYLDSYENEEIEEIDQFAFTNLFLYIQKTKETQIDF